MIAITLRTGTGGSRSAKRKADARAHHMVSLHTLCFLPVEKCQDAAASGVSKTVDPINVQSLIICAPVLTQMFLVQT